MGIFDYGVQDETSSVPKEHRILNSLSEKDWKLLLSHVEQISFQEGERLIRVGDIDRSLFIILDGRVSVFLETDAGERELGSFSEGSVFGEIAFFDGAPRSAEVRTTSTGTAIRISREKFEYLNAWEPEIALTILMDLGSVLATRLRETTEAMRNSNKH